MSTLAEVILRDTRANQPAAGSTPAGTLYYVTDESVMERCTGSAWEDVSAAGSGGMTNPMTTAGDIIYSSDGSGTPARLAVGSNDEVLTLASGVPTWAAASGGSGLDTGSSFPGSPSTGDRYRRSDIDYMVFFYDGTRWVSEQMFSVDENRANDTAGGRDYFSFYNIGDRDIYLLDAYWSFFNGGTNNGSNYWSYAIERRGQADGSYTTVATPLDSSALSGGTWYHQTAAVDTQLTMAQADVLTVNLSKTGSPGGFYGGAGFNYRIVAT